MVEKGSHVDIDAAVVCGYNLWVLTSGWFSYWYSIGGHTLNDVSSHKEADIIFENIIRIFNSELILASFAKIELCFASEAALIIRHLFSHSLRRNWCESIRIKSCSYTIIGYHALVSELKHRIFYYSSDFCRFKIKEFEKSCFSNALALAVGVQSILL